jgi:hypothetical protein
MNIYRARQYRSPADEGGESGSSATGEQQLSQAEIPQDILDEALAEGWRPEDEYSGKAPWVDAETFVKRGREINPILKKNNDRLLAEIKALKAEVDASKMSVKKLEEHNANIETKAYERAIKDLKAQRREAMKQGELDTAMDLEDAIEKMEEEKPQPTAATEETKKFPEGDPRNDPVLTAWATENKRWFNDDNPEMVDYANVVGMRLRRQDPDNKVVGEAFLAKVLDAVKKQYPEKFTSRRESPAGVEGASGGGRTSGNGDTRLADLPAEARAAFRELAKEDWYVSLAKSQKLTPEQLYIKDYQL